MSVPKTFSHQQIPDDVDKNDVDQKYDIKEDFYVLLVINSTEIECEMTANILYGHEEACIWKSVPDL